MPPRSRRLRFSNHSVTAVVVSHDGEPWLAESLAALAAQTRPPQRVVAVDTGSTDGSPQLLADTLGESAVLTAARETSFAAAVQAGLDAFNGAPAPPGVDANATEWLWVLHDDCAPDPDALAQLLERIDESPSIAVVGAKQISWDRRVLLEVGLTTDSSGGRVTGLEPREVDQGQHDNVSDVLAVSTAGMLVRRSVWDAQAGFDAAWPLAGEDLDFGWRVNAAGGRVVVEPRAVVRHAQALHSGERNPDALGRPMAVAERVHGMQAVLANTSPWLVPLLVLRYPLECVLRAVAALLLLRSPARARDELIALGLLVSSPHRVVAARRARRPLRERPHLQLRPLLAPPSWRLRHAGDMIAAAFAGRRAVDERQRRRAPVETGPVSEESESFTLDDLGVLARMLARPPVLLLLGLTVLSLVADRQLLGGTVHGGRLLPASAGASDLWSAYVAGWHPVDVGSTTPAAPVIALLALISTICFGKVWLAVEIVMLGAVPLAALSAYVGSRMLTARLPVRLGASVAYALAPVATGAIAGGRIDVLIGVILLPLAARACVGAATRPLLHRVVAAGLVATAAVAALPVLWPVAMFTLLASAPLLLRGTGRRSVAAVAGVLVVPVVVLLPFVLRVLAHPVALIVGAGLPETFTARHGIDVADLFLLHPGGAGLPPLWVAAPLVAASVLAAVSYRREGQLAGIALAAGIGAALLIGRLSAPTPGGRFWSGSALVFATAAAIAGAVVAIDLAPEVLRQRAFGWRQPAAAAMGIAALAGVATTAVGWLGGVGGPLTDSAAGTLPIFAQAEAAASTSPRILVVRSDNGVAHYALLRGGAGLRLGDADVAPSAKSSPAERRALARAIADAAGGQSTAASELAEFDIALLVVPTDSAGTLQGLAAVDGLARVPATSTVVYRSAAPTGELIVLPHGERAGARGAVPLVAQPGQARLTLPTATTTDRLLVLAEGRSSEWRATLDGKPLPAATAYGWAQAWRLPAAGGTLTVARAGSSRSWLMWLQLGLLIAALVLCLPAPARGSRGTAS